ncbi:MAG: CopD family protein [Chthoniobacter sp.]|nr:CopD family protein [Chthoniobacter sp.]
MEHSALHALLLCGLTVTLGGVLAIWWLILPAARARNVPPHPKLLASVERLISMGALAAALATLADFFVQAAEIENQTVFGGVDLSLVLRFITVTTVGQLDLTRGILLLLTAAAVRLPGRWKWSVTGLLALGALVVTALVSHAAAQPENRAVFIVCQIAHLAAVAAWMGVLLHLFAARRHLLTPDSRPLLAEIVRRFSPFALAATSLLALTGVLAACRFLHSTGALFTSAYGLTLLVKLTLLAPAVAAGFVNYRFIRPALLAPPDDVLPTLRRFGRTLELEVTAGVLVITVAGILASVSPPGDDGSLRLSARQTHALLTPHWPTSHVDNWMAPDDPRGPTLDDLHYSEFTHNWSGVVVTCLGIGWLVQASGGRFSIWAGRINPFLLLPFGGFIAVLANPELWLLHYVSPWEAITNPQILEHQIGAVLVFVLAWLSWRDLRQPPALRPLGYPLPVIMIVGSLLLLGHAHSTPAVSDELTNLINVQHAVLGACGLFAGTVRWFVLRDLIRGRWANLLWPAWIIALGLFMAFGYREAV